MKIFRLGRLQFAFEECEYDAPQLGLRKGDPVIGVHIPADGAMTPEACDESFALAREFFAKYYPDYAYRGFTSHTWLLDPELKKLLNENTNIIRFQERFVNIENDDSDAILRYVFKWNTTGRNLKYAPVLSKFAESVKRAYMDGVQFHETYGFIEIGRAHV